MAEICSVPGCDIPVRVKRDRLCNGHYLQHRAGKPYAPIAPRAPKNRPTVCILDNCTRPVYVIKAGLCSPHYHQLKEGRPFKEPRRVSSRRGYWHEGRKWCTRCEALRPPKDFAKSASTKDGLQHWCRACRSENYRANAEKVRDTMRLHRFGLDREAFDALLESQGGRCAICGSDSPGSSFWHVDHDHSCCAGAKACGNCIRGILCGRCNTGLGHYSDDPERLESAARYLRACAARLAV